MQEAKCRSQIRARALHLSNLINMMLLKIEFKKFRTTVSIQ